VDRRAEVTKFITREQVGIEIAPYFAALVPKREGYRSLVLDVFDTERLCQNAAADSFIDRQSLALIESVDLVGTASSIATLVERHHGLGSLDYVVSSHNFEHLPDPITFLQGCEQVLKPGGVVSMAIPDRRVCFNHFRPHTTTADLLQAFIEKRTQPASWQQFLEDSLRSTFFDPQGREQPGFGLSSDVTKIAPTEYVAEAWQIWQQQLTQTEREYVDRHCWAFTPSALELVLRDLMFLGVLRFEVVEVSEANWHEFYVHLRKPTASSAAPTPRGAFYARRAELLRRANAEAGSASFQARIAEQALAAAQERIATLEASVQRLSGPQAVATTESNHLARQIEHLNAEVEGLRGSKSWQLTRPLRIAAGLARQVNRRLRNGRL